MAVTDFSDVTELPTAQHIHGSRQVEHGKWFALLRGMNDRRVKNAIFCDQLVQASEVLRFGDLVPLRQYTHESASINRCDNACLPRG